MSTLPTKINLIADQLRALANNGLHFTDDPYQVERFQKILRLAAELNALTDPRSADDFEQILLRELEWRTPLAVVDTAVFDDEGRILLIRRTDNKLWAMPGGGCDTGEAPAVGAAREVWEETGYITEIGALIGVFDSRLCGSLANRHLYHFLFGGTPVGGERIVSSETLDVRWFAADEIPWSELSPGHEPRIHVAFAWQKSPDMPTYFDRVPFDRPDAPHFSHL
jgi:ADP-ribose pyrophosphatase YjhB (NUDIX family)